MVWVEPPPAFTPASKDLCEQYRRLGVFYPDPRACETLPVQVVALRLSGCGRDDRANVRVSGEGSRVSDYTCDRVDPQAVHPGTIYEDFSPPQPRVR